MCRISTLLTSSGKNNSVKEILLKAKLSSRMINYLELIDDHLEQLRVLGASIFDNKYAIFKSIGFIRLNEFMKPDNELEYSSHSIGEAINHLVNEGVSTIYFSIEDAYLPDAGVGLLQALGLRVMDKELTDLEINAKKLYSIFTIDDKELTRFDNIGFKIVTDKDLKQNLRGVSFSGNGADSRNQLVNHALDRSIRNYVLAVENSFGVNLEAIIGGGTGGGIVASLEYFLNALVISKEMAFLEILAEYDKLKQIDNLLFVFHNEHTVDKNLSKILALIKLSKLYHTKAIAVIDGFITSPEMLYELGFNAVFEVNENQALETILEELFKGD